MDRSRWFPRLALLSTLCLVMPLGASGLATQGADAVALGSRWYFTAMVGFAGSAPTDEFEEALILAGYDDSSPSGFFTAGDPIPHPRSTPGAGGYEFEFGYEHPGGMGVAVSGGRAELGPFERTNGTVPAVDIVVSHWRMALGFGIHFWR